MAKDLTLNEALKLNEELIVESDDGTRWIKIEDLQKLMAEPGEQLPKIKTFDAAKVLAAQDPELQDGFADPPRLQLGPSPAGARP